MTSDRSKLNDLCRELANCRSDLTMLRLQMNQQKKTQNKVDESSLNREIRLLERENVLEHQLKKILAVGKFNSL